MLSSPRLTIGRAPGKIILLGEHAVVYGQPAIGLPLSRGIEVTLAPGRGELELILPPGFRLPRAKTAATPQSLVDAALGEAARSTDLSIRFEVPPMAGLGSSAALAVALLRARGIAPSLKRAIEIENIAHGRSSGVDPAIALASGPIVFANRRSRPLSVGTGIQLVVGARGGHGGTGRSVGRIADMKAAAPKLMSRAIETLGETTRAGEKAIGAGDLSLLAHAIELAHGVLSGLALVSPAIEETVRVAKEAGALAAKMSGAGGKGGAFFALARDRRSALRIRDRLIELGAIAWLERIDPT